MQITKISFSCSNSEVYNSPERIIQEYKEIGSNEKGKINEYENHRIDEIHIDPDKQDASLKFIYENSKEIFSKNGKSFFIGGDHSISYPLIKGFIRVQENPLLIVFDSRVNCSSTIDNYLNLSWIRKLVEEGLSPVDIMVIGARNISKEEMDFIKKNKIRIIQMDIIREDIEGICDVIMEKARESNGFYLSIDLSVLDPAYCPAASFLDPGGLSSGDLFYFIKRLSLLEKYRGGDIVELNLKNDFNSISLKLASKLLVEMISNGR